VKITSTINGQEKVLSIEPNDILLDILRREGYKGVKEGCRKGTCGACVILLNGKAVNSCMMLAVRIAGQHITTIEGLGTSDAPHPLQQAFIEAGAIQCGYCTPGAILSAKALLDEIPHPSEAQVREALDGNLCRCTGYVKQVQAVLAACKGKTRQR
jgi:aerobic-type carbon monoxide dehydrogenase small subunit (CoxS/CutS family)